MAKVLIKTSEGDIKVRLYDETPQHRDNFIKLAKEGYFDGTLFHRVIKDFMIQGGDPDSKGAPAGKNLGTGGPDYTIPAEFVYPQLFHKRGALSAARLGDEVNPERESSGSQFYIVWGKRQNAADIRRVRGTLEEKGITLTPIMVDDYEMRGGTPHLDGQYTVFGEVIDGMDVIKEIQKAETDRNDRPVNDIKIIKATIKEQ